MHVLTFCLYFIITFYNDVAVFSRIFFLFFLWHYNNGGLCCYSHMARSILLDAADLFLDMQLHWLEKKQHFNCSQFHCILYGMDYGVGIVFGYKNYLGISNSRTSE